MPQNIKNKSIFWDYDLAKADLADSKVKLWYLSRKLRFGDFSNVTRRDLKKFLPRLNISRSLKELLANFLKSNA